MLDTGAQPAAAEDEATVAPSERDEVAVAESAKTDEELADEVVVEISVDGMCGVY